MNFLQNFYHDFLYDYSHVIKRLHPKYVYQYLTRGFSDLDLYNLDRNLSKVIYKRIKAFSEINDNRKSFPCNDYCEPPNGYEYYALWKRDLKKIEFAFEKLSSTSENWMDADKHFKSIKDETDSTNWVKVVQTRRYYVQKTLELFGQNFRSLWI
tara:strand:+ start:14951 stop:15412 length:462 start_codon:yes stop_codon:yes gene_type:complete